MKTIEQRYEEVYVPLLKEFGRQIKGVKVSGIPEPHLPAYGKDYDKTKHKIVFVGIETKGWGDMKDFPKILDRKVEEILRDNISQLDVPLRPGSFWNFIRKVLAKIHQVDPSAIDKLKDFAWANANSIERFSVTAKERAAIGDWTKVKAASLVFDSAKHVVDVLKPDLMIILWWSPDATWLTKGLSAATCRKKYDHHMWHYEVTSGPQVIWTAHPRWLSANGFERYVIKVSNLARKLLEM